MAGRAVREEKKEDFKEWLTSIFERAIETRKGFTPETLARFEDERKTATPRRQLNVKVAKVETHELDPELKRLLERNPKAVIAAEQLGVLLTDNVNGRKFRYSRDWVEA